MKRPLQRRRGFTLLDVATASVLAAILAAMLSSTWVMFGKPTSSLIAWGQLFQEMDIAVATMARDLGGGLPDDPTGNKRQGLLVGCRKTNDPTYGDHLQLCFDGGSNPDGVATWNTPTDDTIIDYYVDGGQHTLMRYNSRAATTFVAASNVESAVAGAGAMIVDDDPNDANNLRVQLTFTFHFPGENGSQHWMAPLSRTCALIVKKQP